MPSVGFVEGLPRAAPAFDRLLDRLAGLGNPEDSLAARLVRAEIDNAALLLSQLENGSVDYDGDASDWLLTLVTAAAVRIDAVSTPDADGGPAGFGGGFWDTSIGLRYLRELDTAADRGVPTRRLFVLDHPHADPGFERIRDDQRTHRVASSRSCGASPRRRG
ncbi:hypothetical protein [Cryptosporangium phraense]|uniref:Uncharacterized protein n=1 Tax=Cryptosporangium phraense TaxID=2593070 RepID=A0A545AGG3_9ACTN|nr:hypothetical protein [Cryptosporangium phraense]TQS40401.1 hypothetical protein FL583_35310 [Cryptosporangium phraense]